jgi:hypothetical protein
MAPIPYEKFVLCRQRQPEVILMGIIVMIIQALFTLIFMMVKLMFQLLFLIVRGLSALFARR